MSLYENVFIMRQDVSPSMAESIADRYSDVIKNGGGEIKKRESWGLRSFAYRMNKNRKGHYVLFNIDAPSSAVLEMERLMRIDEDVLRYLTVRVDTLEEGPSAILRQKDSRESYSRNRRDSEELSLSPAFESEEV